MSEYIPKYPSKEDDDSNKTSSELLAETLKPIYVPQDLMLAWESHLASYSRDTHVLLDQVKDSETALTTQYQTLLARVQKYEQMLQDITMDSNEFTMDTDVVNFTGWNILAQASYWDYLLRKEITKLSDQIKSAEFKGPLIADVSNSVLESLSTGNHYISNIIGALTDSPLIRDLDAALSDTSTGLSDLRLAHETLKAKQYADAIALADQNGETFDQLTLTFNNLISEQIDRIADEAATRTRVFQELEDGITVESQLRHEGQETIATAVFALKASTETAIAGIKQEYSTIAGTNEAITSALTTYTAEVDGTIATILTDYVAYANLDSALTSKSDKLLAIVNENIGKLNITNEIQAGLTSIKALSTVSVDLNGVVSGYGLISELENGIVKSAFGVNADTFYVGKPTDAVKPFVVTTTPTNIDGIDFPAGTWINTAIIANATIGSAHIKDASITNAKIKDLDASKITTGTVDARFIRIGSSSQFDSGYAPSDVINDAKTYVNNNTGNLVNNPGVSGNTLRWSSGMVTDQNFLGAPLSVLTLSSSGDLMSVSDKIDVDPAKAYEVSVWVKKSVAVGSTYLGLILGNGAGETIQVNAVNQAGSVSLTNNFYHWNVSGADNPTNWIKLVAYIMPAGTNPLDMQRVGTVPTNAFMSANTRKLQMRLLNYYNGGTSTTAWFANPKIVEVDSNAVIAAAKAQILADSKTQTFNTQPTTPYTSGDIYRNSASIYVCTTTRVSGSYVASDWTLVGDVTANNTAADTAKVNGVAAATVTANAQVGKTLSDNIMSDLIITPVEKSSLLTEWNRIKSEYTNLYNQAIALNISTVDFSAAYTALDGTTPRISSEVLASMITNYTLTIATRDALRAKLNTYFSKAVNMSVIITTNINTLAAAAQDTANQAVKDAQNKSTAAEAAAKTYADAKAKAEADAAIAAASNDATSKANAAESAAKAAAALDAKNKADAAKQEAIDAAALDATAKANAAKAAAKVLSDAAQKAADDAREIADNATLKLSDISSDEKLTPNEKQQVKLIWDEIDRTHTEIVKQAGVYSLSTTAYLTKYNALSAYISPLLSSMSTTSNVVRATFQANFADYYSARAVLGNAISTSAKNLADAAKEAAGNKGEIIFGSTTPAADKRLSQNLWIDTTGGLNTPKRWNGSAWVTVTDKAATDAAAAAVVAQNTANSKAKVFTTTPTVPYVMGDVWKEAATVKIAAVSRTTGSYTASDWILVGDVTANNTAADTAKVNGVDAATVASNAANGATVYADVMSDLKITPVEKTAINREWDRIQKEYASLLAQAQALSLTTTTYTSAYTDLSTTAPAMSTILASMSTTTTLTAAERDAYKTQYTTYYTQAVAITKAITDKIAANAKAQADAKAKTFTTQPVPPYTTGDLWKDGTTIRVCTVTRASDSYTSADWTLVGDVTSANTAANANQLGGRDSANVFSDITGAKSAADTATAQLTLWKYPNTTEIDGGRIRTNTITANQIQVGSLSAISANLGTIQVGTANIAEGAISTAKIGDLQVDTIKVKDNAVTNGIASQNTTSLTIVTDGGQVRVNVGITHYSRSTTYKFTNTLILYRDGSELKRWTFTGYWNSVDYVWEILLNQELPMVVDIVGAGTHTYSLSGLGTTSMALLEVKK